MKRVEEVAVTDRASFDAEVRPLYKPVVMRGIAGDWPLVHEGRKSAESALHYVERLDTGAATDIMLAPSGEKGRFFYRPDMRGFNFERRKGSLSKLAQHLRQNAEAAEPIGAYAGATSAATHLPGFEEQNVFPLIGRDSGATTRIWLGNATQVATHFDMSDNFAVVVLGKRTFTLFPPSETENLYVGPFDVTLAGQPVSMVDPLKPDLHRYPRFAQALEHAQCAELEPGDVIYIPTLWWHHVQASAPINILVNYWHNDAAHGGGFLALVHAMLAIRDQPKTQREAWRAWFEAFVFGDDAAHAAEHLPEYARGVTGAASPQRDERIRQYILQVLSQ